MVDFAELWETINDKCWPIAEAVKLDEFFDEKNIPPVILPLAALLLILVLAFVLMSGGSSMPEESCGNDFCSANETFISCPNDCPQPQSAEGKDVLVRLNEIPDCTVTVKLYSSDGELIRSQEGQEKEFSFPKIDKDSVYVVVFGPYKESTPTPTEILGDEENIFDVTISNILCQAPAPSTGVLRLTIKDSNTGTSLNGVKISIAETQSGFALNYAVSDLIVNGVQDFPLPLDKSYTIYASRDGYESYNGESEPIVLLSSRKDISKAIPLIPLASGSSDMGDLEVCARNGTSPMTHGLIGVESVLGDYTITGEISEQDPTVETTGSGCYVFEQIPAETMVTVSMSTPPAGCIPTANPTSTIQAGKRDIVYLNLDCTPENSGYLKVKLLGDDVVLTQNATITVWTTGGNLIPGTGIANTLSIGAAGFSEEIVVPANTTLYFWARGLPIGYLDHRSDTFSVSEGEHRELEINLNESEILPISLPSPEFTFTGVSSPNLLSRNQAFNVTINQILYDETELTGNIAKVSATLDSQPCDVFYDLMWHLSCMTPNMTGDYTLMIDVKYQSLLGAYDLDIGVWEYVSNSGLLTITPVFSTYGEPPLDLFYDIKFNGTIVKEITNQTISVTYLDSPNAYAGVISELTFLEAYDYWTVVADVPYKGDYQLDMYIEVFENGVFYETFYTVGFSTTEHSAKLQAEVYLSDVLLTISDSFDIIVILTFDGKIVPDLEILEVFAGSVFYSVPWEEALRYYNLPMSSTSYELCNMKLSFLINDEKITDDSTVHVINTEGTKSVSCPLDRGASCSSREDMRRCVYNQDEKISHYGEDQLLTCIQSGCPFTTVPSCPSANKGDLEPDCILDEVDYDIMDQYLLSIRSQTDRNELASCLDMDNDEDVDDEDLDCLKYLISTSWYGDVEGDLILTGSVDEETSSTEDLTEIVESVTCSDSMKGGFCFDIDTTSPLPGDIFYSGNIDKEDEEIMQKIITAVSQGVTPHEDILEVADYNQDGTIDDTDLACLQGFKTANFETGDILSSATQISTECMPIFGLDCKGTKGDLDGDGIVSETDFVILRLMAQGQMGAISGVRECADVNGDNIIDEYDEECMTYYFTGDQEQWMICLDCNANTPGDAYGDEICHDGYDNDCDGLTDTEDERCECGPGTPCDMKWDADSGTGPGVNDGNYKICRDVDWDMSEWKWFTEDELMCTSERACGVMACEESITKCSSDTGTKGEWFDIPEYCCLRFYKVIWDIDSWDYRGDFNWTHDATIPTAADHIYTICATSDLLSQNNMNCAQLRANLQAGTFPGQAENNGLPVGSYRNPADGWVYPPQYKNTERCSMASESYYLPCEGYGKNWGERCGDGWDNDCRGGDATCSG